jgi:hypothetical protein
MKCYQNRNDRLSDLGLSYSEYLATPEWAVIRGKVFDKFSLCAGCNKKASCVHHTDYDWDTLLGLCLDALIPLCDDCHKHIEFFENGLKCSLRCANKRLRKLIKKSPHQWVHEWSKGEELRRKTAHKRRKHEEKTKEEHEAHSRFPTKPIAAAVISYRAYKKRQEKKLAKMKERYNKL